MTDSIPVILFTYNRPWHVTQVLEGLRSNNVELLYIFSDGPRTHEHNEGVLQVRKILSEIDWCKTIITERTENLGLGRSILRGVTEVLEKHDVFLVCEDDVVCVAGAYNYLCTALHHYADTPNVFSVTGWNHPRITPNGINDQPYFDGRAECLIWGSWARVWVGMESDAQTKLQDCQNHGIDIYQYGADLPSMAEVEHSRNLWAVRFLYHHIQNHGLCMRPPHSLVKLIGDDEIATNAKGFDMEWTNFPPNPCPPIPDLWPEAIENPSCPQLHQTAFGYKPKPLSFRNRILNYILRKVRSLR